MSEGFAYLDILFFAIVAAFIAFRLRNVLGRKTGQERRRTSGLRTQTAAARVEHGVPRQDKPAATAEREEAVATDAGEAGLKAGLTQVRLADPNFSLDQFLEGARAAFGMIVEAFARGDKAALRPLLADDVYNSFAAAIDERAAAGQTMTTELVNIDAAEIVMAEMRGTFARLSVRFTSEQSNLLRDAQDNVIEGDAGTTEKIVDLWTFERDTHSGDPNWALVETRSPEA